MKTPHLENSILGFCAVHECIFLLLPNKLIFFDFVLFVDYVFNFLLLRNVHYWSESGTPVAPIGQQNDHPNRNSITLCCSVMMYF